MKIKKLKLKISRISIFLGILIGSFLILGAASALETGLDYGSISGLGTQDIRISVMKIVRIVLGLLGIMAVGIVIILLNSLKTENNQTWLEYSLDYISNYWSSTGVASIILVIILIAFIVFIIPFASTI